MCALRADPRLTVFRPTPSLAPRPLRARGPRFTIHVVPQWRPLRARSPWLGAVGHCALLALLGLGLTLRPPANVRVAASAAGPAGPNPFGLLAERPQVALEPFGLWWGLMGTPSVAFADPTLDAVDAAPAAAPDAVADSLPAPAGEITVPWRTQLDGSRFAGANCGPASLGMVLDAFGTDKGTDELRYRSHTYQGTWGSYTGTALEHLAHVAEDFGVPTRGLYDGRHFHTWTTDELREELRQGHPIMILVKYRLLPGHEGSRASDDHYIVLWGLDGDKFVYNDPAFTRARDGFGRRISAAGLAAATSSAIIPGQAVAFLAPKG
ncbi:MAG TPA: C39 family peptidase [Chloroflexota bacterium]|nr:C39 family peptidase [Chloroflexota bacterium]